MTILEECPIKSIEAVKDDVMDNMYVKSVLNRVRELQSPEKVDQTRWIWELLQNAQDSLEPNKQVSAVVNIMPDKTVTFQHDGGVFTGKAMCGLMYKYSEGKRVGESTGRFGTGFMTTLTLSQIIEVETNIYYDEDNTVVTGFRVILYRNGFNEEQIKEGLHKMRDSFQKLDRFNDFTTRFTYRNSNEDAINYGHQSFINCGAQTMLFATKVKNFTFNYMEKKSKIERKEAKQMNHFSIHSFKVTDESKDYERKFLVISIDEPNEILTEKYERTRNLRLQIAIEFNDTNLVSHDNKTCLYCTFPLIGSEKHQLPFILNCPDFEPDTERQFIMLEGEDEIYIEDNKTKEKKKMINLPKINKSILTRSLDLFKELLSYLMENKFNNFHFLTNGLCEKYIKTDFTDIKHMNEDWYRTNIIFPMRKILEDSKIVKTIDDQMTNLKDAYFPIYEEKSNKEQREMYHKLLCHKYPNKTVTFEESESWRNRLWESPNLITIERLVSDEEALGIEKEEGKKKIEKDEWEYLNLLLEYTKKYKPKLLSDHSIIPDMNEKRHKISDKFYESKSVHPDMLEILESIHHPWKTEHMHNNIDKIQIPEHFMKDAIQACIESFEKDPELSFIISSYIPKEGEYVHRRQTIYEFNEEILGKKNDKHEIKEEIDKELWIKSDKYLIQRYIETIKKYQREEVKERFELCHKFVTFLNEQEDENEKKYLNDENIVPNENYVLCSLTKLRDKSNIPNEFKEIVKQYFKIDIKNEELNSKIEDLTCKEKSTIQCFQELINYNFSQLKNDKRQAAMLLTHAIPKDEELNIYKIQSKLLKLLEPFETNNEKIIIDYGEETLWKLSNDYVKENIIKEEICKYAKLKDLTREFSKFKSDDDTIDYLNLCYEFITTGKIMPNQYGDLCKIDELEDGRDVDEDFLDLLYCIDPNKYDYRKKLSDKRIKYANLKRFDIKAFYQKVDDELKAALKNPEKRDDPKFIEILQRLKKIEDDNYISFFSDDQNAVAHRKLIYRIYVENVKNFLRDLNQNNADYESKMRWGFELIQNARDTIINIPGRKVSITIIYEPHKHLIFRHNGEDFTFDSLLGLLFKMSEGKEKGQKTIGRFGTGFMSTHILNKVVELQGNLLKKDGKRNKFWVQIDRRGSGSNELIEHAENMTKSLKESFEETIDFTEFKYSIENENVDEIIKIGLECIHQNLPTTLISCPEIEQVKVINNNKEIVYKYNSNDRSIYKKVDDGSESGRYFLVAQSNQPNAIFSQFKVQPNLQLSIIDTLEIENNSIKKSESESLFCSFPLIGSKKMFEFTITINSPNFEPSTERNKIFLNKKENQSITESSVNKEILEQSVNLFKNIVDQCINAQLNNLFFLANGLLFKNPNLFNESFDREWYTNTFIDRMHKVLENSRIVKTIDDEKTFLKDAYFPIYEENSNKEQREMYHKLLCHKYPNKTVTFEESESWRNRLWESPNLITIERLVSDEEALGIEKEEGKKKIEKDEWEYLNLLLEYTKKYKPKLLSDHSIIPDMNEKRHKISDKFYESKSVHPDMLEILESIHHPWKTEHMHNNIDKIQIPEHFMKDAIQACIESFEKDPELSFIISSYIPKEGEYVHRRQTIYEFNEEILGKKNDKHEIKEEIDKELWIKSDKYLIQRYIETIKKYQREEVKERFELCHKFVTFLNEQEDENEKKYLNDENIVPNENYVLCSLTKLRDKSNIPNEFKEIVKQYFKIDINNDELNRQINDIHCSQSQDISIYQDEINEKINEINNKIEASEFLFHFRPKENLGDIFQKVEEIQSLYNTFIHNTTNNDIFQNDNAIQTNLSSFTLWDNASKIIIKAIMDTINNFNEFEVFKNAYNFDEERAISLLNMCYIYEQNIKIPLLDGQLCLFSDSRPFYRSDNIDKDIIKYITLANPDDKIKSESACRGIVHPKLRLHDIQNIASKINYATVQLRGNKKLRDNPEIMKLIEKMNWETFDNNTRYNDMNNIQKEKLLIFGKLFITNLGPRLRELENPSESMKKRWPWELIQNAKDTIVAEKDKKIDIKFTYDSNHLIFQHNGSDFTLKQYLAMVYKFSQDKHENKESTGKFGCGFLTTHIISRVVILRGNLKKENGINGFEVTLDRTGHEDSELEESLKRTEESKIIYENKPFEYTSFEYKYNDPENIDRVNIGIENLKKNLPLVLLFCSNINSVVIKNLDKDEEIKYSLPSKRGNIIEVEIKNNDEIQHRRFIYFNTERQSKHIPNLYSLSDRNKIEISAVIEIDSNNKIISHHDNESLYCVFPLVGSKLRFPFIINSPQFETLTDRNGIFLKSSPQNTSTYDEINYEILQISLELYKQIIEFCISKNCSRLGYLAEGLKCKYEKEDHFNPELFSSVFLKRAIEILISYPVFITSNGRQKYNDVYLIDYSYPTKEEIEPSKFQQYQNDFYSLFQHVYSNPINFEESISWFCNLWDGHPFKLINHLDLLRKISNYGTITGLPFPGDFQRQVEFINETLDFVFEYDKIQFKYIKLIPNQNQQFCIDNSNLYFAPDVYEEAIQLIHRLGGNWRINHVFQQIKVQSYLPIHEIKDAESMILGLITKENAKIMMEYIIPNHQMRIQMHDYSCVLLNIPKNTIELPGFSNDTWRLTDLIVAQFFIERIESLKRIQNPIESVKWLNDLINFLLENNLVDKYYLQKHIIFPNENQIFKDFSSISRDRIIYKDIKDALQNYCKIDIKNILLHQDFTIDIGFNQIFINKYRQNIIDFYKFKYNYNYGDDYQLQDKLHFSLILFKYITNDGNIQENQKLLLKCYNFLLNNNIEEISLNDSMDSIIFNYVSEYISYQINQYLKGKHTISNLQSSLSESAMDKIINYLNILYKFAKNIAYVPCRKGIFRRNNKLVILDSSTKLSENVISLLIFEQSIKNLLNNKDLCEKSDFLNYYLAMEGINCPLVNKNSNYIIVTEICKRIDSKIKRKCSIIITIDNIDLKILLNDLINFIDLNDYWQHFSEFRQLRDFLIANYIVTKNDRDMILKIHKMPKEYCTQIMDVINKYENGT